MAKKDFKTKGFSYNVLNDIDVISYIEKQPNQSSYIWELVRKDMSEPDELEIIVKKYVEELLKNKNIEIDDKKESNISKDNIADLLNIGKS